MRRRLRCLRGRPGTGSRTAAPAASTGRGSVAPAPGSNRDLGGHNATLCGALPLPTGVACKAVPGVHILVHRVRGPQVNDQERTAAAADGAWNPGLESHLPGAHLPLPPVFRAENVSTSAAKAYELRDYCGLPAHELVAFRPERLIVHELLVRVTSSLSVPDGPDYEDLGRNFRRIAATILDQYVAPHRAQLTELFARTRSAALALVAQ